MEGTLQQLATGDINPLTCALWILIAAVFGGAGGCIGANFLGGKHLGKELVFMMGVPFGALAAVPGVIFGLLLLKLI